MNVSNICVKERERERERERGRVRESKIEANEMKKWCLMVKYCFIAVLLFMCVEVY